MLSTESYQELVNLGVSDDELAKAREQMKPKPIEVLECNMLTVQVFVLLDLRLNMGFGSAHYSGTDKAEAVSIVEKFTKDDKIIRDFLNRLKIIENEACRVLNQRMSKK